MMNNKTNKQQTVGVFSWKLWRNLYLKPLLNKRIVFFPFRFNSKVDVVAGWGLKPTTKKARRFADKHGLPYISIEDGFLRSFELGVKGNAPLSMVVDEVGIYYDATRPSLLENMLNSDGWETPELIDNAQKAVHLMIEHNLSKYNHAPDINEDIFRGRRQKKVLVVDQTLNDMSVILGMADKHSFAEMYKAACSENPEADIYIKVHPDVIAGKKRGYLLGAQENSNTFIISDDVNPLSLMKLMDKVYVVSSQMGFEALLLNKPVVCFGMPFYAGWGLTDDRISCERRSKKRTATEIFAAAYIKYARYINPLTGKRGDIFDVINHLIRQKNHALENNMDSYCIGFRWWKHSYVRPFMQGYTNKVVFVKNAQHAIKKGLNNKSRIIVWGNNDTDDIKKISAFMNIPVWRMEDGFIRSVGLGSDFVPPMSLVIDERGIYYNPQNISDLEYILNCSQFSPELISRAQKLRDMIVNHKITKYNIEPPYKLSLRNSPSQKIIFVPGQVEDDASIRLGCEDVKTNTNLLKAVRQAHPNDFIVYKPHPDVMARNRKGKIDLNSAQQYADYVETTMSVLSCIDAAHEVHTMTSLSGFDALIRGKRVVVFGRPFYAGWGLTEDRLPVPRRNRRLSLDDLVAGALLIYPRYWDWMTRSYVECETVIQRIIEERVKIEALGELGSNKAGFLWRQFRKVSTLFSSQWSRI